MEYLPEKKRTQKTQILKKEAKIKQFRQELVDNNVVLAIVKCKSQPVPNLSRLDCVPLTAEAARGPPPAPA